MRCTLSRTVMCPNEGFGLADRSCVELALQPSLPVTLVCGLPGSGTTEWIVEQLDRTSGASIAFAVLAGASIGRSKKMGGSLVNEWDGYAPLDAAAFMGAERLIVQLPDACSPVAMAANWSAGDCEADTMVVVVRAPQFLADFGTRMRLKDHGLGVGSLAELPLVELLAEQIECASRVVLTHSEAMGRQEYDVVCEMITALNPSAIISRSNAFTAADLAQSGGFGVKDWWSQTRWAQALLGDDVVPNTVVFRSRRPFHPERFHAWLQSDWGGVLRAKGRFWLASQLEWVGLLSQVGAAVRTEPQGYWWAVVPPQDWPDDPENRAEIFKHLDDQVGDCRQELAFVGLTVEGTTLRADLNACLLTDSELELGPQGWHQFTDPVPGWALD